MPMIDFRCETCGATFEKFFHVTQAGKVNDHACECGATAIRYYEFRRPHSYTGLTESAILYRDPTDGHYYVPASKDARVPEGMERVELRSAGEIRRVEREMTAHEYEKWQNNVERREILMQDHQGELRKELIGKMGSMSNRGKDFARFAIGRGNDSARPKFRGEVYFEAFSMDSSNRGDHRDASTDWHRVKR